MVGWKDYPPLLHPTNPRRLVRNVMGIIRGAAMLNAAMQSKPYVRPAPPLDPMAGFAAGDELERYQMWPNGFFLGKIHPDHGRDDPAGLVDDRHVFVMAGNRSGKGLTLGIPNALTYGGPLFAIDPKGEMASIAAMRRGTVEAGHGTGTSVRHFMGQRVGIIDPRGVVVGPARALRVQYDPLTDIDMSKGGGVAAIQAFSANIIKPDAGDGAHFSETAQTIAAGLVEAVKLSEPRDRQSIMQFRSVLLAGYDALRKYLAKVETRAGLATEAVTVIDEVGEDEWGSFRSTLSRNLRWMADHDMQDHMVPSAFSLRRAVQEGWSIFVCLPPNEISRFSSWLRIIVGQVLAAKMESGFIPKGPHTLCLLDEFPTLGTFKPIEESAGYMAGYGLKLVPFIQNLGQVKSIYRDNWETFFGNAGGIIAFGLNDAESEEYIAKRCGRLMVTETSYSQSAGTSGQFMGAGGHNASASANTSRHERPVRFPNEIHEQGARETGRAFVIPASGRAFTVSRVPYTAFPAGMYDAPQFLAEWEKKHWHKET